MNISALDGVGRLAKSSRLIYSLPVREDTYPERHERRIPT
jgi:hypothetical protein